MKQYDQKTLDFLPTALRAFALATGLMIYLPFFLIFNNSYLIQNSADYIKDIVLLISSSGITIGAILGWKAVYKQFNLDRTKLGFPPDKNGYLLASEIVAEATLTLLVIYFSGSGF